VPNHSSIQVYSASSCNGEFLTVPTLSVLALTIVSIKPVADDDGEEFQLSDDDSDSEADGPLAQPTPDCSEVPLTPRSNTLCTDTIDSNAEPSSITDMALFFDEYVNNEGETMRRCNACL
jgi:hypothetical protein